jgi:hypothetical protein
MLSPVAFLCGVLFVAPSTMRWGALPNGVKKYCNYSYNSAGFERGWEKVSGKYVKNCAGS